MKQRHERGPALSPYRPDGPVRAAALLLPGGSVTSHRPPLRLAERPLRDLHQRLAEAGTAQGLAVHLLRYRYRGWNGEEASALADSRWALAELERRYGDVPVCLVGYSLGGRAAFRAAGHRNVAGVVGIAPWLPPGEPVGQLARRRVLIVQPDRDRGDTSPAVSLAYAERARSVTPEVCRFEVAGVNHYLLRRTAGFWALTTEFVLGTLTGRGYGPLITQALASPDGLRVPLAPRYGRST